MATQVTTTTIDDLDGISVADQTVEFTLDGDSFEIDLTDRNAAKLRDILGPFVKQARRVGNPPKPGKPHTKRLHPDVARDVRVWVREHGGTVADRGRISPAYVEAYFDNDQSIFK